MQLLFDVKRSLAANPPNYPENKGITHVERKRGKLSSLRTENEKGISLQPREKEKETGEDLKTSFRTHGVLYDREVMVAE